MVDVHSSDQLGHTAIQAAMMGKTDSHLRVIMALVRANGLVNTLDNKNSVISCGTCWERGGCTSTFGGEGRYA